MWSRLCWTTISCADWLTDTHFDMRTLAIFKAKIMPVHGWVSMVLYYFFFLKFLIVFPFFKSSSSLFCTALQFLSVNLAIVWSVEVCFSNIHWNHVWLVFSPTRWYTYVQWGKGSPKAITVLYVVKLRVSTPDQENPFFLVSHDTF